jgi:hypothetical protein
MDQMSPTMAKQSQALLDGSLSQKKYGLAAKDMGGEAGALGNQFLTLYKANSGVTDSLKAGKPAVETYAAALRDTLGNVTAMRAAQMLLMNDGREFQANIKAIGEAGNKTGQDISTWADMQSTLSVQLDQTKAMASNFGIELGTKLVPAAKDTLKGATDLFHGFEQGNPVLLGIAGIIGGALLISTVNFGIQMGRTAVKTVSGLVDMGATAIAQSSLFVKGMMADELAVGQFSTKAELAGSKVKGMGGAMVGVGAAAAGLAAGLMLVADGSEKVTIDAGKMATAVSAFGDGTVASKASMDNMFSHWSTQWGMATSDIHDVNGAVDKLLHEDVTDQMSKWGDGIRDMFGIAHGEASQNEAAFKSMGDELGKLAGTNITKAQSAFQQLALKTDGSKDSLQKLLDAMPGYKNALEDQVKSSGKEISSQEMLEYAYGKIPKAMQDAAKATGGFTDAIGQVHPITPELQKSLDDAGVSADGLATDLGKVLDGMLNKTIRDGSTAVDDLIKSHVDVSHALNDTATDFNLADEAGATLNDKFTAVKDKGLEVAKSMVGQGKDSVVGALQDTYDNMLKAADSMGIHGQAAVDLTRNLLGIPKNVDVKTWVDTAAAQAATDKLQGSLNALPTFKSVSVNVKYTESGTQILKDAQDAGNTLTTKISNAGGAVSETMGFFDGGIIPGTPPSNPKLDNILTMVDGKPLKVRSGEFITNEPQTKANLPWLKASNAGLNIGQAMQSRYANGFAQGAAQAAPAMASSMSQQPPSAPQVTIHAQTNASAAQIANELAWVLRTH